MLALGVPEVLYDRFVPPLADLVKASARNYGVGVALTKVWPKLEGDGVSLGDMAALLPPYVQLGVVLGGVKSTTAERTTAERTTAAQPFFVAVVPRWDGASSSVPAISWVDQLSPSLDGGASFKAGSFCSGIAVGSKAVGEAWVREVAQTCVENLGFAVCRPEPLACGAVGWRAAWQPSDLGDSVTWGTDAPHPAAEVAVYCRIYPVSVIRGGDVVWVWFCFVARQEPVAVCRGVGVVGSVRMRRMDGCRDRARIVL